MRTTQLLVALALVGAALVFVPAAEAAPPCVGDLQACVTDTCILGVETQGDCVVRNPCDPRICDVWWP